VTDLESNSNEDLKKLLKKRGYSEKAIEEILKWYNQNNS
jgi:SOS response regulatory protein OraA/RecX